MTPAALFGLSVLMSFVAFSIHETVYLAATPSGLP